MKILLITTSVEPFEDSQTIRIKQLISTFSNRNVDLKIIAPSNGLGDLSVSTVNSWPFNTNIHRTEVHWYLRLKFKTSKLNKTIDWFFTNICYYLLYPDLFTGWNYLALDCSMAVLKNWTPDLIISSSGSNTAHLAALQLKERFNKPWVADFGDPWSLMDAKYRPWFFIFSKVAEKKILTSADLVLFTTPETLEKYRRIYSFNGRFLYYGFVESDFAVKTTRIVRKGQKIELSHIGAAFKGDRNLIPTMIAVSENKNKDLIKLNIIGNHSVKFESVALRLGIDVNFEDRVPFAVAADYIKSSDLLVLVGNKGGLQIPGKVFHYIGSLKPILYISQRSSLTDPSFMLLSKFGGVIFVENNNISIEKGIDLFFLNKEKLKEESLDRNQLEAYKQIEASNISNQFYQLICDLSN